MIEGDTGGSWVLSTSHPKREWTFSNVNLISKEHFEKMAPPQVRHNNPEV